MCPHDSHVTSKSFIERKQTILNGHIGFLDFSHYLIPAMIAKEHRQAKINDKNDVSDHHDAIVKVIVEDSASTIKGLNPRVTVERVV